MPSDKTTLYTAGQALLDAAYKYWEEFQGVGGKRAVTWLQGSDGSLVVFTRGEYAEELKDVVSDTNYITFCLSEEVPDAE